MTKIWKYTFEIADRFILDLPIGSNILKIDVQNNSACMWARIIEENPKEVRFFIIYGTGQPIPDDINQTYIDTVQHGPYVWHVFESHDIPIGILK